jgi:esterase/lipase superfamily enzyme
MTRSGRGRTSALILAASIRTADGTTSDAFVPDDRQIIFPPEGEVIDLTIDEYKFSDILSFKHGRVEAAYKAVDKLSKDEFVIADAALEGLSVAGRFKANRLHVRIDSHSLGRESSPVNHELSFVGLTLDGYEVIVVTGTELFSTFVTRDQLDRAFKMGTIHKIGTIYRALRDKIRSGFEYLFPRKLRWINATVVTQVRCEHPGVTIDGNCIALEGFGSIHFGEYLAANNDSRWLTLVRIHLTGSSVADINICEVGVGFKQELSPFDGILSLSKPILQPILYATDRAPSNPSGVNAFYSGMRNPERVLNFGTANVNVPRGHKLATLEIGSIWNFEAAPDPKKHWMLTNVTQSTEAEFFQQIADSVQKSRDILLYIHGYNVTFTDAVLRTAQLCRDLVFGGTVVLYSWTSQGNPISYFIDETNVGNTTERLREFVLAIAEIPNVRALHVIAHSMGNRAMIDALRILSDTRMPSQAMTSVPFANIVFAAPDVDAENFADKVKYIRALGRRLTLYASEFDSALLLSKKFHGFQRAGQGGASIVLISDLDTIDASQVDASLLGHAYYGSNPKVVSDIRKLIHEGASPSERGLRALSRNKYVYYVFPPTVRTISQTLVRWAVTLAFDLRITASRKLLGRRK